MFSALVLPNCFCTLLQRGVSAVMGLRRSHHCERWLCCFCWCRVPAPFCVVCGFFSLSLCAFDSAWIDTDFWPGEMHFYPTLGSGLACLIVPPACVQTFCELLWPRFTTFISHTKDRTLAQTRHSRKKQRKLMGSSAENSSGVHWCRRRVMFNEAPEKVREKTGFRRRFRRRFPRFFFPLDWPMKLSGSVLKVKIYFKKKMMRTSRKLYKSRRQKSTSSHQRWVKMHFPRSEMRIDPRNQQTKKPGTQPNKTKERGRSPTQPTHHCRLQQWWEHSASSPLPSTSLNKR